MTENSQSHTELLALTADIVASHFANNTVAPAEVPGVIESVYATLARLGTPVVVPVPKQEPAVSIRSSIKPDHIVCLEDGKKLKMLKRHLPDLTLRRGLMNCCLRTLVLSLRGLLRALLGMGHWPICHLGLLSGLILVRTSGGQRAYRIQRMLQS